MSQHTIDLTKLKTVGFSASTGKALWTADGSDLTCAGGVAATKLQDGGSLPVRCEYVQGQQHVPGGAYTDLKAGVVGYDPLTGKAGWKTDPEIFTVHKLRIPTSGRGDTILTGSTAGAKLVNTTDATTPPSRPPPNTPAGEE